MQPNVTWFVDPAGACTVFMHEGDVVRHFTSPTVEIAERSIVSVSIDAFGMTQAEAEEFAAMAVADHTDSASLPDHVKLLQEQLADSQKTVTEHEATIAKLQADNKTLADGVAKLTKIQTAATGPTGSPGHNPSHPIPPPATTIGAIGASGAPVAAAAGANGATGHG